LDISFIIPAHNAGNYLQRVYESIRDIDLDKEIIIIENASTDDTYKVASEIASADTSVVLCESKAGVSYARNEGIKKASGKWLCFVDADDFLIEGTDKVLKASCKHFADDDLVVFAFKKGEDICAFGKKTARYRGNNLMRLRGRMLENPTVSMTVWSKLYRRSVIDNNDLFFDTNLSHSEDSDFLLRYTAFCKSIVVTDRPLYNYSIDNTSTMRSYTGDKIASYTEAMEKAYDYVTEKEPKFAKQIVSYVLVHFNIACVREIYTAKNNASSKDKLKALKSLAREDVFDICLRKLKITRALPKPRLWPVLCCKLKLYRVASLAYKLRASSNDRKESHT